MNISFDYQSIPASHLQSYLTYYTIQGLGRLIHHIPCILSHLYKPYNYAREFQNMVINGHVIVFSIIDLVISPLVCQVTTIPYQNWPIVVVSSRQVVLQSNLTQCFVYTIACLEYKLVYTKTINIELRCLSTGCGLRSFFQKRPKARKWFRNRTISRFQT